MSRCFLFFSVLSSLLFISHNATAQNHPNCPDESYFTVQGDDGVRYGWFNDATCIVESTTSLAYPICPDERFFTVRGDNGIDYGWYEDATCVFPTSLPLPECPDESFFTVQGDNGIDYGWFDNQSCIITAQEPVVAAPETTEPPIESFPPVACTVSNFYQDLDSDGYTSNTTIEACEAPAGFIAQQSTTVDCDDNNQAVSTPSTFYVDLDGDGFTSGFIQSCMLDTGLVEIPSLVNDCNDDDVSINPDATEIAGDGIDQNCSGTDFPDPLEDDELILVGKYAYTTIIENNQTRKIVELDAEGNELSSTPSTPFEFSPDGTFTFASQNQNFAFRMCLAEDAVTPLSFDVFDDFSSDELIQYSKTSFDALTGEYKHESVRSQIINCSTSIEDHLVQSAVLDPSSASSSRQYEVLESQSEAYRTEYTRDCDTGEVLGGRRTLMEATATGMYQYSEYDPQGFTDVNGLVDLATLPFYIELGVLVPESTVCRIDK